MLGSDRSLLIGGVAYLIHYLSRGITAEPG
jgi:hypothetical protein